MSLITLVEQSAVPVTPTTGKVRVYINSGGTLSSVDDAGTVTTYGSGITPEEVQDIVGALLQDSASVNVTYDDAGDAITFDVIAGGVNHNALLNYVANEHINHASVNITAGTGLSGGGDLTASRTLNIANTAVAAGSYGSSSQVPSYTVNAQGQLTAAANVTITPAAIGAQPLDSDLTAVAGLTGTGLVTRTGAGTATTRSIAAGTGLGVTNADGVSGNPTVALSNTAVTAGSYGSATQVPNYTVNAQGQLTAAANTSIAIPSTAVTDFSEAVDDRVAALVVAGTGITATYNDPANTLTIATTITQYTDEQAQDAVGTILTDTASVDLAYNDAGNQITATVLPAGVNHNALNNYVANEHINHSTVNITAGTGLSGGGDITTSRTLNLANTTVSAGAYGSATQVPNYTVDAQGRLTAAANTGIAIPSTAVTDFTEAVQDVMGGALVDSASVDFVYNDVANTQTANVLPAGVNHDALLNFVANEHVDHSTVSLVAGTGISATGLGDLTASRTINLANTAVTPGTYGSSSQSAQITVDAQGRITAAANVGIIGSDWQELINTATLTNNSNVTLTRVPNLAIDVVAGRNYRIEAHIRFRSAAGGTGIGFTLNSPDGATGTVAGTADIPQAGDGTGSIYSGAITSLGDLVLSTAVPAANTDYLAIIAAQFTCTGSGTVEPFFRSETNGTTVTVQVGSNLIAREWA